YVNLRNNDPIPGLERVVLLFVGTGNSSASTFVSTINRIYPIEFDHRRAALALQRLPLISYEDFVLQDSSFGTKVEVLLEAYCAANDSTLRRELAQQAIHLLQLSKDLLSLGPEISRFSIARNNAKQDIKEEMIKANLYARSNASVAEKAFYSGLILGLQPRLELE